MTVALGNVTFGAQRGAAGRFLKVGSKGEKCEGMVHEYDAVSRDYKTRFNVSDRPVYLDCGFDVEMNRVVEERTHGGLSASFGSPNGFEGGLICCGTGL